MASWGSALGRRGLLSVVLGATLILAGGCSDGEGLRVVASAECGSPVVMAVDSGEGNMVLAGRRLFSLEKGSLAEVMAFSGDYSSTGSGFGNAGGAFVLGTTQLDDGRLALVRQVRGDDGNFDHHELVLVTPGDEGYSAEIVIATPVVKEFISVSGPRGAGIACVSYEDATDQAWLTVSTAGEGDGQVEVATREIAGRPAALASGGGERGPLIAVVGLVPDSSFEPRLEIFDLEGAPVESVGFSQGYERPSRLFPYSDGARNGWLIEWWEDAGNRLTLSIDGTTSMVTRESPETDHDQVVAVGEVLPDSAGQELVMNVGRGDSDDRRAVVASLSEGYPVVLFELGGRTVSGALIADIDGDGHDDLVCIETVPRASELSHRSVERVGVWLSDGNGLKPPIYSAEYEAGVVSVAGVDLDDDGVLEIVVGYEDASGERAMIDVLAIR